MPLSQQRAVFHSRSMPPLRERQRKRERDNARKERWAAWNPQQATTTTAPGGLELQPLWQTAPSGSSGAAALQEESSTA